MRIKTANAFTLIELLIVIAIIAILTSIMLPSLNKARETSRSIACSSQERQVLTAMHAYADTYNGIGPGYGNNNQIILDSKLASGNNTIMHSHLLPFLSNKADMFHCPSDTGGQRFWRSSSLLGVNFGTSYGHAMLNSDTSASAWNITPEWSPYKLPVNNQLKTYSITSPSKIAFIGDSGWCYNTVTYLAYQYHSRGYNVGFLDGHCSNYKAELYGNEWNKGFYRRNW